MSHIYFIQAGKDGPVKIGLTTNLKARFKALDAVSTKKLTLLRVIPGSHSTERWLHRRYSSLRIKNEWFDYDETMLSVQPPKEVTDNTARNQLKRKISRALRKRNSTNKTEFCRQVESLTGIKAHTIDSYYDGVCEPGAIAFLKLCAYFGPSFEQEVAGDVIKRSEQEIETWQIPNQLRALADEVEQMLRISSLKRLRGDANVTTLEKKGTVS